MKVPQVSLETWRSLYEAAERFKSIEPWELFYDSQMFAVKDPATGETGYCCILGAMGEVFALCVYRGSEGLDFHQRMQAGEFDPAVDDLFAVQSCLMAEFVDRPELKKEDLAVIKSLGLKFRGPVEYPCFRSHLPGCYPWFLTEEEALFLTLSLECACKVVEKFEAHPKKLKPKKSGEILTFESNSQDGKTVWNELWVRPKPFPLPTVPNVPLDQVGLQRLKNLKIKKDSPWEADFFYLPGGIIQDEDRPYWGRLIMITQESSGFIFHTDMIRRNVEPHIALRDAIIRAIEKHGFLPVGVNVKNPILFEVLKPLADVLGFEITLRRALPTILEAKEALAEQASRGFRQAPAM